MFTTPLFEVKITADDSFGSLSYDKNMNPTVYRYFGKDKGSMNTVNIPPKAFERLTLATFKDGSTMYAETNGNIVTEKNPQGL